MSSISAIIIAKNEENMIADCIDSVSFCDETVVIDNGSTDKTPEIAKRMRAKVYFINEVNFAALRNIGASKAKNPWIIYIDADERVSTSLRENIEEAIKKSEKKVAGYRVMRKNYYFGKHEWPQIEKLERLFVKKHLKRWYGDLHETAEVSGKMEDLRGGYLLHYTHRDLSSMLRKTIEWSKVEAKLRFDSNHPVITWWRFPRVMLTAFFDSYIRQKGYKAGTVGVIESMYQSFSIFITYARLWEMQRSSDDPIHE